jgi:hypothetical protein
MIPMFRRNAPNPTQNPALANKDKMIRSNLLMCEWLSNTKNSFSKMAIEKLGGLFRSTPFWCLSNAANLGDEVAGNITLITQFFIGGTPARTNELKTSLRVNSVNAKIDKIILLNERIYTNEELGVKSDKIQQIVIGKRLDYKTVFDVVEREKIDGYIVLANLDIFFDKDLDVIKRTNIANEKAMFCLVRHEYKTGKPVKSAPIFEHISDSQDTWIWHSNHNLGEKERNVFDFQLGIPGCDNTLAYLIQVVGYKVYNLPRLVKSFHIHNTNLRNYDHTTTKTPKPYYNVSALLDTKVQDPSHPFTFHGENDNMRKYLEKMIATDSHFIIPRLAGIEHNYAVMGAQAGQRGRFEDSEANYINRTRSVMKNNAGIFLPDGNSIVEYSNTYLKAFHNCDAFMDWEPQGDVAGTGMQPSYEFIYANFNSKQRFWSFGVADIFHLIYQDKPWTHALSGKRLLIISPFEETFKKQLPVMEKIYGRDMFPGCTFTFLKPPVTNGSNQSRPFPQELDEFANRVEAVKDTFDVALVSCGGYGNPILGRIYDMGKSAIYVGGVLQMFFGVYGSRWERERPLVMKLFKNEHWVRPASEERPAGFEKVEDSCYW